MTTLADLMRDGATKRPQVKGALFVRLPIDGFVAFGSCALGSVYESLFGFPQSADGQSIEYFPVDFGMNLRELHGINMQFGVKHPKAVEMGGSGELEWSIIGVIQNLNDSFGWTRERIADWLDTLPAPYGRNYRKLSQLIRDGAQLAQQACLLLQKSNDSYQTCALGAAMDASVMHEAFHDHYFSSSDVIACLNDLLDINLLALFKHPVMGDQHHLSDIIISLNDTFHWTRERIADFVESCGL